MNILTEYRQRYETELSGVHADVLNRVRTAYLHNVDEVIRFRQMLLQAVQADPLAAVMMDSYIPFVDEEGGPVMSMKKVLLPWYDEVLRLNELVIDRYGLTATKFMKFLELRVVGQTAELVPRAHESHVLLGVREDRAGSINFNDLRDATLPTVDRIVKRHKIGHFYTLLPYYRLNDRYYDDIHHEFQLVLTVR